MAPRLHYPRHQPSNFERIQSIMHKVSILHLLTSAKNASPFDVNMAVDAGYEQIMPYTNVALDEVVALTQDAMFSRSTSTKQGLSGVQREALFFGGRDIHLSLAMQKLSKNAMFKPFEVSTMADPSGAFTTAAAMLAIIDKHLHANQQTFNQQTIAIFGATGTVGGAAALIAASLGANVVLVAHKDVQQMQTYAQNLQEKYAVDVEVADGTSDQTKTAVLQIANIAICAAAAGVRVLENSHFVQSSTLKIMADVNAVAPSGIDGVGVNNNGDTILGSQIVSFGALAIGDLKYKTQQRLLQNMLKSEVALHIDYEQAFKTAKSLLLPPSESLS